MSRISAADRPASRRGAPRPATDGGTRRYRRAWQLLLRRERRRFVFLAIGMMVLGLLEMAGVASVLPFLALAGNPAIMRENRYLRWAAETLGITEPSTMIMVAGVLVVVLIVVRNGFLVLVRYRLLRFGLTTTKRLAGTQLSRYLNRPYTYYLGTHTSNAKVSILTEVMAVSMHVLIPTIEIMAAAVSVLGVMALLMAVDWALALISAGVLGGVYGLAFLTVRSRLRDLGRRTVIAKRARMKALTDAFGGIKEILSYGRRKEFIRRFSEPFAEMERYRLSYQVISMTPRYVLETIAFCGIVLIVLYLLADRESLGAAVSVLGVFAVAGYRLIPALQQIFGSVAEIRYHMPSVDYVYEDMLDDGRLVRAPEAEDRDVERLDFRRGLRLEGVSYRYPEGERPALEGIDVEVPYRGTVAFVGQTGAGKTTLVDIVLGLIRPQAGRMAVDGIPIDDETLPRWQQSIGYVPQHIFLYDDTVARNIAFGVPQEEIDEAAVREAARVAHVEEFILSLPDRFETRIGEHGIRLSGGQRQRIGIARALYHDPPVLLFDEATSALDGITEAGVMKDIRGLAERKTIILVAHRLTTVRHADRIYVLEDGRIVDQGTYDELARDNALFRWLSRGLPG